MTARLEGCPICKILETDEFRITESAHWDVRLAYQQMRPGRCMTILKRHAEQEVALTDEEWIDLRRLRERLHPAILAAFGATHLNTSLLMNGAFKKPGTPLWGRSHVHYWDVPRYRQLVTMDGATFEDPVYPTFNPDEYGPEVKDVSPEVRQMIIHAVKAHL